MSDGSSADVGGRHHSDFARPPHASSLLSSRWSKDNLLTPHPGRLYDGRVVQRIDAEQLSNLVASLAGAAAVQLGAVRMGVFTWDIACGDASGAFTLQIPRVLDEPGRRGRRKRDVPAQNFHHSSEFLAQGLARFAPRPIELISLREGVAAARFSSWNHHHPISLRRAAVQVEVYEGTRAWGISLGPELSAHLLAEIVAALVYHYEPDRDGGVAVTDVVINDGDFVVRRREDGSFELRMTALRRREAGVGPSLLLLYLIQLMAFEDWSVDDELTGLPVLASNPSVAFEGVVRGVSYRYRDLGLRQSEATEQAKAWISDFARSSLGRAYRPWAERFLDGDLPLEWGSDPRERGLGLSTLQQKCRLLQLRARSAGSNAERKFAAASALFQRLWDEQGKAPLGASTLTLNEMNERELQTLLGEARVTPRSRASTARQILRHWPYRRLDLLVAKVPAARELRRLGKRVDFGRVISAELEGTLSSLESSEPSVPFERPASWLANDERMGTLLFPEPLHHAASTAFASFETYMDTALHDPSWGYYSHQVQFGQKGHFTTNPEALSPRYGGWVAALARKMWLELIASGELGRDERFVVIEFGAGNARLARDFVDVVHQRATSEPELWADFAKRLDYRIYERSEMLRELQRQSLGSAVSVHAGDARHPAATLASDFPRGVKGLFLSNEVPDAFGVHKVLFEADGTAWATLVVARIGTELAAALPTQLSTEVTTRDESLRREFALEANADHRYLDVETYERLMTWSASLKGPERGELMQQLYFEEAYVPASTLPELAEHLREHGRQYAVALAQEPSGVVCYVNVHAARFVRELGAALAAGYVLTIDYGETTLGLVEGARRGEFPFRVYGEWIDYVPRPNDPYAPPGSQDLTADVNFTELADAGATTGLQVAHFGPERDLAGDELVELVRESSKPSIAEFLGNPVFKLLLQSKHPSALLDSELASRMPLRFDEQHVPEERRTLVEGIERRLRGE